MALQFIFSIAFAQLLNYLIIMKVVYEAVFWKIWKKGEEEWITRWAWNGDGEEENERKKRENGKKWRDW